MSLIGFLPHLNGTLNGVSFVFLSAGYVFIKKRKIAAHRACMLTALGASILFLVSYVTYHAEAGSRHFPGTGIIRPVYFFILITHVILAAVIVPMAIVTVRRAFREQFDRHRAIARWTWPLWIYVSATGLIVYFLLYHLYA
ncbi:MAG TPA: DUF420 domain-containing protein [Candidatus Saccharimonadales bacterium]|nr:DUF420 domain-containing protein [Candidatus Saccharimonadales bacterium]